MTAIKYLYLFIIACFAWHIFSILAYWIKAEIDIGKAKRIWRLK